MRSLRQWIKNKNSASIRLQKLFRKYFRYARMTSLKFSKFNFTAAVDNIYAQFTPVNRGLNSAYIIAATFFFESTSGMPEWLHWNFQSLISPLLQVIFMRSLRQWVEEFICIFHVSTTFRKYFLYARMALLNIRILISPLLLAIFMRTLRQCIED